MFKMIRKQAKKLALLAAMLAAAPIYAQPRDTFVYSGCVWFPSESRAVDLTSVVSLYHNGGDTITVAYHGQFDRFSNVSFGQFKKVTDRFSQCKNSTLRTNPAKESK